MDDIQEKKQSEYAQNANQHTVTEKRCSKCKKIKPIKCFTKDKGNNDGLRSSCRECKKKAAKKYYNANIEKIKEKERNRYKANPEKAKERANEWAITNPMKVKKNAKKWRVNNPEKYCETKLIWTKNNLEKVREIKERWRKNNPDSLKQWVKRNPEKRKSIVTRHYKKCRTTPMSKLNNSVSGRMRFYIKKNKGGIHWEELVGFTLKQFKRHLEKQFLDGMTWENYGYNGWHVDHNIPVSVFNFEKPDDDDFKRCWSLKNLQPMWARENIIKSNKIDKPFQPRLIFK